MSDDIFKTIWTKVTVNSVLNPLCTILDKSIGEIGAYTQVNDMVTLIIKEIVAVANAKGVHVQLETLLNIIEKMYPKTAQGLHYPSMHQDYNNGRPTEIDYLNGQVAQYGESLGINTPVNQMLTHQIHQLEMKNI